MKLGLYFKYVVTLCALVVGVLLINASILLYLVYNERFADAAALQGDKAREVALRVEYLVRAIESQMRWVSSTRWANLSVEARRLDYLRLMRQVPAISQLIQVDRNGREKIRISRLGSDALDSNQDLSEHPAFEGAMSNQVWFGPIEIAASGQISMILAMAHDSQSSVTIAEISVDRLVDFVGKYRIAGNGYLYLTDAKGRLFARSDGAPASLGVDVVDSLQVEMAKSLDSATPRYLEAVNGNGTRVLSTFVLLPSLNWFVFIEQPIAEVQKPIITFFKSSALLLLVCVLAAGLIASGLAYRALRPIRALGDGARRMGAGDLSHRIVVETGDELEGLAAQLNVSAAALQRSREDLEKQVSERTAELREALELQLAAGEILDIISQSEGDVRPALDSIVGAARRFCGAPDAAIALRDDGQILRAAHEGPLEAQVGTRDPLNRTSATGRAIIDAQTVQVPDVLNQSGEFALGRSMALQMGFRSALAAPMVYRGRAIGCLLLRRPEPGPFTARQVALLERFAAQAVVAVQNARLMTELKHRENELRVTFDHMADGVAMFDAELRLVSWNRNLQELLDFPADFLAGRPTLEDYMDLLAQRGELKPEQAEAFASRYRDRLGEAWSIERQRPDGRVLEVRNNPVPEGGAVLIYSDITRRKKAEAEIRSARDAAELALDKLKAAQANLIQSEKMASLGQLTAGIAHEIKNPLNFVNNFASLSVELLDEYRELTESALQSVAEDRREEADETMSLLVANLNKIVEHGKRADGIVRSMLSHSRGGAGDWQACNMNTLVEEALNLGYHGARANDSQFNATIEKEFAAADLPIDVVPQDITRVFLNLIGNAFYAINKRRRAGTASPYDPRLRVTTRDVEDHVEVRVRDNGTGIAADVMNKLFEPFFTTKPTGEGTGLGLSISYDIIAQQHGGTLTVDSELGSYTEFTVRLPRKKQAVQEQGRK